MLKRTHTASPSFITFMVLVLLWGLLSGCETVSKSPEDGVASDEATKVEGSDQQAVDPGQDPENAIDPALVPPGEVVGAPLVPPTPPSMAGTVRVALLLPMSGPNAALGDAMLNAAQMALFDFADDRFEVVLHDTAGEPFVAANAASQAISEDAALIIGPLLGRSVVAVRPVAEGAGIPVIAFSSNRTVAGNGVYTMGFLPGAEVDRVVSYALSRGLTRFAIMAPDSDYGRTVVEALALSLEISGGELVRTMIYDPFADDYSPMVQDIANYQVRRQALLDARRDLEARDDDLAKEALKELENLQTIGDLPYDALLVADGGERLQNIAALLPFYDVDPAKIQMLGTGQWDVKGLGAEPALLGGWYAAPDPKTRQGFEQQYFDSYGVQPPRLATLAYDAVALAAVLARVDGGPGISTASITQPLGFAGRDGIFRFKSYGLAERGLAVLAVGPRESRIISEAPNAFVSN